jgi:SulP family sulfate permease
MINEQLADLGIQLHFSEIKGPIMDRLGKTEFIHHLSGRVYPSHFAAYTALRNITSS